MFYPQYLTPKYGHYDARLIRKALTRPSFYPTRPHRRLPMYPKTKPLVAGFNPFGQHRPNMGWMRHTNQLDRHYWRYFNRKQPRYLKNRMDSEQSPYFTTMATSGLPLYTSPMLYEYESEIRYVPYPVNINRQSTTYGGRLSLGNGAEDALTLPPKIRVIFIPTGASSMQQAFTGPLVTYPFSRIWDRRLTKVSTCLSDDATISIQSYVRRCVCIADSTTVTTDHLIAIDACCATDCNGSVYEPFRCTSL